MRILHISSLYAPYYVGGAERVVEVLAEGAAKRGHDVAVGHLAPQPDMAHERNGVAVHPFAHRNPLWIEHSAKYPSPIRNLNKVATLLNTFTTNDAAKLVAEFQPHIVHTHSMVELPPFIWRAAKARGAKMVHTLHDFDLLCIRGALFKDGQLCVNRHAACKAFSILKKACHTYIDAVVGCSRSILEIHQKHALFSHLPATHRRVIWNPSAFELTLEQKAPHAGPIRFGFLGRVVPEKGINVLLEACRLLGPAGWTLRVGGRVVSGEAELHSQAAGLPIEFLGFVDPSAFLREIDVLVAPILWSEPFGLTVVEAMAAGVPVIGSDIGGVAEVIESVDPDWLVRRGDASALAVRMRALIDGGAPNLAGNDRVADVLHRTTHSYVVDEYLDVYAQAMGRAPDGRSS